MVNKIFIHQKNNQNQIQDRPRRNSAMRKPTKKEDSVPPIEKKLKQTNNKVTDDFTEMSTLQTVSKTLASNQSNNIQGNVNVKS